MESVKELKAKLAKAKRNVSRLERELIRAKKLEQEAQEAERARKIKELLEANANKIVCIELNIPQKQNEFHLNYAKEVIVEKTANGWMISVFANWAYPLEYVKRIFVEAEI